MFSFFAQTRSFPTEIGKTDDHPRHNTAPNVHFWPGASWGWNEVRLPFHSQTPLTHRSHTAYSGSAPPVARDTRSSFTFPGHCLKPSLGWRRPWLLLVPGSSCRAVPSFGLFPVRTGTRVGGVVHTRCPPSREYIDWTPTLRSKRWNAEGGGTRSLARARTRQECSFGWTVERRGNIAQRRTSRQGQEGW
jgi:hypothetical protein